MHGDAVVAGFKGRRWTHQKTQPDTDQTEVMQRYGLEPLVGTDGAGLGRKLAHWGSNSGYQAINLAYLLGASRIILLGYDMQRTGGQAHWFGEHPKGLHQGANYTAWAPLFHPLAADLKAEGVDVINCSRETALTCFARAALDDVL